MTRGEKYGGLFLTGVSAVALAGAVWARFDSERPYRNVPHVPFSSVLVRPEVAHQDSEEASQAACDRASKVILQQFKDNDFAYAEHDIGIDDFYESQHSLSAELLTACEDAPHIPTEAYTEDPSIVTVFGR